MAEEDLIDDPDALNEEVNRRIMDALERPPEGPEIPLELDPEAKALLGGESGGEGDAPDDAPADGEEDDPSRGRETNLFQEPPVYPEGMNGWRSHMPDLDSDLVEPTAREKAIYLKAILHDVHVQLDLELAIGVGATMRSLNNFELELVYRAVKKGEDEGQVNGPGEAVSLLQRYTSVMQFVSFAGEEQPNLAFEPPGTPELDIKTLTTLAEAVTSKNSWATWQMKLTFMRLFDEKLAKLNRSVMDQNFWSPAGSA